MLDRRSVCLMLAGIAGVFGYAERADACGALPCAQLQEVQPADGARLVPQNPEIRVLYFGSLETSGSTCDLGLRQLRLVPSGGEPLDLAGTTLFRPSAAEAWVVATPPEALLPDTEYVVQTQLSPGRDACRCDDREWTTLSTFITGSSEDHEAPAFGGLISLQYGPHLIGESSCGRTDAIEVRPTLAESIGESADLRYNIYVEGRIERRFVRFLDDPASVAEIYVDCGSNALTFQSRSSPNSYIEIRAVDSAGNESAPTMPVSIRADCEASDEDDTSNEEDASDIDNAFYPVATPATPSADDAPGGALAPEVIATPRSESCAVSPAARTSDALWLTALLLAAGIRRCKRRS